MSEQQIHRMLDEAARAIVASGYNANYAVGYLDAALYEERERSRARAKQQAHKETE
jgi:hypothetical protein